MASEFEKNRIELAAELYAQGRRDGWLAALAAVEAQMPGPILQGDTRNVRGRGDGWNRCLSTMSERIAALKESAR